VVVFFLTIFSGFPISDDISKWPVKKKLAGYWKETGALILHFKLSF